ncbi:polysaccharide deacetylase family protein [Kitasatospora viridis]|uniref:Peptidoglycan/xylan/chitin deacetylase (PgdA/CDA1 family) n=1 Tax=Kitasatospora viridis TaxID=281105 RepID=A0A561UBD9_9ACTN|nr:polysaccharide deacetylase family protein [Kitasatospora viridis]TWF96693.1 peptidoglycan/xylan/chitin deacetylase (PgdA/CDA1 family) [Kitasatospora viridis]
MRTTRALALTAGALALGHGLPALTSLGPVRPLLAPKLSGPGDPGHVALTFDDGPDPASTPLFLEELAKTGTKATFFLLGQMLEKAPWLGRDLVDAGHEVAVHGWAHRPLLIRGPRATLDDVTRAKDLIASVTGQEPAYYRPPYGVLNSAALYAARRNGLRPVLWTHWGQDWTAKATPDSVLRTVTRGSLAGATLLLHDSDCTSAPQAWRSTLGALPRVLERCAEQGLKVGPLREHGLR